MATLVDLVDCSFSGRGGAYRNAVVAVVLVVPLFLLPVESTVFLLCIPAWS